jgi:hypothetical protein
VLTALAVLVCVAPAANAALTREQRIIISLRAKLERRDDLIDRQQRLILAQSRTITRRDTRIASLEYAATLAAEALAAMTGERDTARAQRDAALAGLPAAISGVPLNQFVTLVFQPARAAWPCDSFYSSGGYWSYTFDGGSFC